MNFFLVRIYQLRRIDYRRYNSTSYLLYPPATNSSFNCSISQHSTSTPYIFCDGVFVLNAAIFLEKLVHPELVGRLISSRELSWNLPLMYNKKPMLLASVCFSGLRGRCKKLGSQIGVKSVWFESLPDMVLKHVRYFVPRVLRRRMRGCKGKRTGGIRTTDQLPLSPPRNPLV